LVRYKKMKKVLQKVIYSGAILSLVMPVASFAQLFNPPGQGQPGTVPITGISNVYNTLDTVANYLLGILIALAVVFIVWGAFQFLTSGGDDKKTADARKHILYALVAIAVGLLAKGLVAAVRGIAGGL